MNTTEEKLIADGWEREILCMHIQEYDEKYENKFRRLSYDISNTLDGDAINALQRFAQEVNRRFPNIKMFATGTGYVKKEAE